MPRLIATQSLRYASRNLRAGEEFDATDGDAKVLCAAGRAADAPPEPIQADAETEAEPAPPPASRYRRRDLRPQE